MSRFIRPVVFSWMFLGLLATTPNAGWAEDNSADITIKAEVNRAFITIGDPVEYRVQIDHTPEVKVLSTVPPPPKDVFKIKKVRDIREELDGRIREGKEFELTTFRLGDFILDPVEIQYRIADGPVETMSTQKIYIKVKSVAEGEEKTDIRGAKSVLEIGKELQKLLWSGAGLIALALIALFVFLRFRKKPETAAEIKPLLSAEDEAILKLNQLFDSDLLRQSRYKEYYLLFSEILRTYLERRFSILAVESTTTEIFRALKGVSLPQNLREKINEVLEAADLAKFAKWKPEPAQIIGYNQKAKEIIEMARPVKRPEGAADGV